MSPPPEKLPSELEEEILTRVPIQSLVRFRSVCKRWNDLFDESKFINNHMALTIPQFIFLSNSNMYSVEIIDLNGVDPSVKLRDLVSSSPEILYRDLELTYTTINSYDDGFLFCNFWPWESRIALWNPWLKPSQVKWMEFGDKNFRVCGLGYDNNSTDKVYKMFGYFMCFRQEKVAVYNCGSKAFNVVDTPGDVWSIREGERYNVSLNGNLYWVTSDLKTVGGYFIQSFDFSKDTFKPFCLLPCKKNNSRDEFVLAVFKGDGFTLLKQCYVTGNIEIWVTKKNTTGAGGENVVWNKTLNLPKTNSPSLFNSRRLGGISYFIHGKTLIMCCAESETVAACIYIVRRGMFKKIQIDSGFVHCCHCVYAPNLIPLPISSD